MTRSEGNREIRRPKNILVVGNGGRENSIAWALAKDESTEEIYISPGNGGTTSQQKCFRLENPSLLWTLGHFWRAIGPRSSARHVFLRVHLASGFSAFPQEYIGRHILLFKQAKPRG